MVFAAGLAGCEGAVVTPPTAPTAPTRPTATLSGWIHRDAGRAGPVEGARVRRTSAVTEETAPLTNQSGRYV